MPFGTVYAALFFFVFGLWLVLGGPAEGPIALPLVRVSLAIVGFSLAVGLLLRRSWARWAGVLYSLGLIAALFQVAAVHDGVGVFVALFGSLAATGLLIVPATGDASAPGPDARRTAPTLGRFVGVTAVAGLVGLASGAWWNARLAPTPAEAAGKQAIPAAAWMPERVRWSDFGTGSTASAAEDRPMLVTFVASWCGYCRKMDRETWKDPAVVERLHDLVAVKVDGEETRERNGHRGVDLAARYGVDGYPTTILLDAHGRVLSRTSGYLAPDRLLGWLDASLERGAGVRGSRTMVTGGRPQ